MSYLITVFDIVIRLTIVPDNAINLSSIYLLVIQVLGLSISIAAFLYGLVHAVRGTLSPKRMGTVLVAYFAACIIAATNHMMPLKAWQQFAVMGVRVVLPNMLAGIAAFYYFIRVDNRKIWICLLALTSVWGIFQAVITLYPAMLGTEEFLALNISTRLVLSIAIDVLVLYQTYTLYKKRRNAIEISE